MISDLVPTLLFSVPGGPAAAIFLGALFSFGYYPGPRMISENPDLMFLIVWSVALSSVVGAGLCFAVTPLLARLTRIPFGIIAAPLILIMVIGAYQATGTMGDIFLLFAMGALGWAMKHAGWPRAPALVGFVLAKPMEQCFWLTNQIHGWPWLLRPGVLIIASLIALPLALRLWRALRDRRATGAVAAAPAPGSAPESRKAASKHPLIDLILAAAVSVAFAWALTEMPGFNPTSRLMPAPALLPGLPLALFLLYRAIRDDRRLRDPAFSEPVILVALVLYAAAIRVLGFTLPTVALLAWMLFARAGMRWWTGAIYGAAVLAVALALFAVLRGDAPTRVLTGLN